MNDYERVARMIRYLDQHHTEQPNLKKLAACAGLSQFHFHRLFSTWAGVTPKDFLQCLTLEHAKARLQQGENVLSTALGSGLSGPGRLHDLCVSLEALSPGEIKNKGHGLEIIFGFTMTPFGECLMGETTRGICHIAFLDQKTRDTSFEQLQKKWPLAQFTRNDLRIEKLSLKILFPPNNPSHPVLRAFVKATPFQVKVWRALLQIPTGCLINYGQLAKAIGHPKAARAVGSAVGDNPLAYLIPCHRVIRETGAIGQYHWGNERKRIMIAWENRAVPAPNTVTHQDSHS